VISIAAIVGIALLLVLPFVLNLGWAPVLHDTCGPGGVLASATFYAPGVVGDAPYGGHVWANGTFPWNLTSIVGAGGNESNGGSFADLSTATFSIYPAQNGTAWGPGSNTQCSSPYFVTVAASSSTRVKLLSVLPAGTLNDTRAPLQAPPISAGDPLSVILGDRYLASNAPSIDTCSLTQPVEISVPATSMTVGLPVRLPGGSVTVPVTLPVRAAFEYWFPPGFGVWLVDDLSANGYLPGAGWAFDYHPCA